MNQKTFPPVDHSRKGFYPVEIYQRALKRYPTVKALIAQKAKENSDKIWLEFQDGRTFSYRQIHNQSDRLAAGLMEKGVRGGDKIVDIVKKGRQR